jgi:hypothetical protein
MNNGEQHGDVFFSFLSFSMDVPKKNISNYLGWIWNSLKVHGKFETSIFLIISKPSTHGDIFIFGTSSMFIEKKGTWVPWSSLQMICPCGMMPCGPWEPL